MGADLFESYIGAIIGSMVLGIGWMTAIQGVNEMRVALNPGFAAALLGGCGHRHQHRLYVLGQDQGRRQSTESIGHGDLRGRWHHAVASFGLITGLLPEEVYIKNPFTV